MCFNGNWDFGNAQIDPVKSKKLHCEPNNGEFLSDLPNIIIGYISKGSFCIKLYKSSLKMHIKRHSGEKPNRSMPPGCAVFQLHPYRLNKQEQLQFVSTPFLMLTYIYQATRFILYVYFEERVWCVVNFGYLYFVAE